MAQIKCWCCGKLADEQAEECPHCHALGPAEKPNTFHALLVLAGILLLGAIVFFAVYSLPR
jgi:hypothetical protein